MSALSLISQFPTLEYAVGAGGANDGAQDVLITQVLPAGTYIGSILVTLGGAGVTSGDIVVSYDGTDIGASVIGAVGVNESASCTFFFTSDGVSALSVAVVGDGANWTSGATTLVLRQLV